jgi:hypothetical protein
MTLEVVGSRKYSLSMRSGDWVAKAVEPGSFQTYPE